MFLNLMNPVLISHPGISEMVFARRVSEEGMSMLIQANVPPSQK